MSGWLCCITRPVDTQLTPNATMITVSTIATCGTSIAAAMTAATAATTETMTATRNARAQVCRRNSMLCCYRTLRHRRSRTSEIAPNRVIPVMRLTESSHDRAIGRHRGCSISHVDRDVDVGGRPCDRRVGGRSNGGVFVRIVE